MTEYILMLTTWPDEAGAKQAAKAWLDKKLVACVNILPEMQSLYHWDGELNTGFEHQMLLKTTAARAEELKQHILQMHPYECPEILQIPINGGFADYLNWIKGNTE
jgi:periplasmic divalent cation tolerance protein